VTRFFCREPHHLQTRKSIFDTKQPTIFVADINDDMSSSRLFFTAPPFGRLLLYTGRRQQLRVWCLSPRGFSTGDQNDYQTGTVKNYIRKKSYGFLLPDGATDPIFVHRTGIKSTATLPRGTGNSNPFLLRNERVRFVVVPDKRRNVMICTEVEYEDGTPIPIYRPSYVEGVKKFFCNILGEAVYQIMKEKTDETVRRTKIKELYEQTKQKIAAGQERYDAVTGKLKRRGEEPLRRKSPVF
jgi:cold shock CspA family protein